MCIQTGDIGANDGGPNFPGSDPTVSGGNPAATGHDPAATGGDPTATGGDPAATGGDPTATGGDPAATGGDPTATGGDPAATGIMQGTHPYSPLPTRAPDVAPLLNKFTCFGYQIASGMVSTRLVFIYICTV